jgi:hypothetical protein
MVLLRALRRLLLPCTRCSPPDNAPEQHRNSRLLVVTPTSDPHRPKLHIANDQAPARNGVSQESLGYFDDTRELKCMMPKRKAQSGSEDVETLARKTKAVPKKKGKTANEEGESTISFASLIQCVLSG